ncbi:transcriptional regulator [Paraburkholderia sp. Cpub6]|uniref:HVO_A0114 family putative DNA-binding protein n=1 Tax=Paraburkholderia sp. Cpub6 TaxID=2723094 RepID=UPI001611EA15|nr:transcriptional regulator [Paraburkholderia sp. Cpub6]MBB5463827.1 putative transcriptional regulator [Paraburkholderia sp. Cpub6]
MTTVTIGVASRADLSARFVAAMNGKRQGSFISFATTDLLFKTLSQTRWQIICEMIGSGPTSIHELACRLDRDVKCVHEDVRALLNTGVLDHADGGAVVFPYDAVHVDFMIEAQGLESSRQREDPQNS